MFSKLKSTDADFSFSSMMKYLDLMNKNILYLTHTMDKCLVVLKRIENEDKLQTQVSDFYDTEHIPEVEPGEKNGTKSDI